MLLEKLDHHSLDSEFIQSSLCAKVVGVVVTCITSSESVEQRKQAFGLISSLYQRTTRSAQPAFLTMAMAHPDMPPGLRSELLKWLTAAFAQDMDADPGLPEFRCDAWLASWPTCSTISYKISGPQASRPLWPRWSSWIQMSRLGSGTVITSWVPPAPLDACSGWLNVKVFSSSWQSCKNW